VTVWRPAAVSRDRLPRSSPRWALLGLAALIAGLFGAWPGGLWGEPHDLGGFSRGLIWAPPNTNVGTYYRLGDRPWYPEYHWHGLGHVTGNLYVLTGLLLFLVLLVLATRARHAARQRTAEASSVRTSKARPGQARTREAPQARPYTG